MADTAISDSALDRIDHPGVLLVDSSTQQRCGFGRRRVGARFGGERKHAKELRLVQGKAQVLLGCGEELFDRITVRRVGAVHVVPVHIEGSRDHRGVQPLLAAEVVVDRTDGDTGVLADLFDRDFVDGALGEHRLRSGE